MLIFTFVWLFCFRNDKSFCHNCPFCDREFTNCNRSEIFEHMHSEHFFNVGHPDNLVFVSELLDLLHGAILRCQCLYCDNLYSDRNELFEHMKRKQHRKLNAKNTVYDKYYIINYLVSWPTAVRIIERVLIRTYMKPISKLIRRRNKQTIDRFKKFARLELIIRR